MTLPFPNPVMEEWLTTRPQPAPTDGRNRQLASLRESDAPIEFPKARVGAEAIHASVGRQIGKLSARTVILDKIIQNGHTSD